MDTVMNKRIVLIALGLAAAFILLLIYRPGAVFHSQPPSSDSRVMEIQSSRPASTPSFPSMGQIGASGTSLSARPVLPAEISNRC